MRAGYGALEHVQVDGFVLRQRAVAAQAEIDQDLYGLGAAGCTAGAAVQAGLLGRGPVAWVRGLPSVGAHRRARTANEGWCARHFAVAFSEQHVAGGEVPVDEPAVVQERHRLPDLRRNLRNLCCCYIGVPRAEIRGSAPAPIVRRW